MAISIKTIKQDSNPTGLTSGNEYIWEVGQNTVVSIQGNPTVAGTARVKYSLSSSTPTDFTGFVTSNAGDHSTDFGEKSDVGSGIRWIGVEIDSGTWTVLIKQTKV